METYVRIHINETKKNQSNISILNFTKTYWSNQDKHINTIDTRLWNVLPIQTSTYKYTQVSKSYRPSTILHKEKRFFRKCPYSSN